MTKHSSLCGVALASALTIILCTSNSANAFDQVDIRVLGGFSNQKQMDQVEAPFFTKTLPQASGGKIKVTYRSMNEVGLKGFEAMRMLKLGIFDILEINLGYVGGDEPFFLGLDMVGASPNIETMKKLTEAYRPYFDKLLQKRFGGKLLALWPFTAQMMFCNAPIHGIADLKGKKVRIYSSALSGLMKSFGAVGVTMAYPEVYLALQRGVIDCAITGSTAGNEGKWPEVTTHLFPLTLSWAMQAHVANLKFWNSLPPDAQKFIADEFKKNLEDPLWKMAADTTEEGISCNTGGPCKNYKSYKMSLVKVTPDDVKQLHAAVEKEVIPGWIKECSKTYPQCKEVWNSTGGKISGMMAK